LTEIKFHNFIKHSEDYDIKPEDRHDILVRFQVEIWLWRRVLLWYDTNISAVHAASIFTSPWWWRQRGLLKSWYL